MAGPNEPQLSIFSLSEYKTPTKKTSKPYKKCKKSFRRSSCHSDPWWIKLHWWNREAEMEEKLAHIARRSAFSIEDMDPSVSHFHDWHFKFVWVRIFLSPHHN
jgi:hypothetical protein